jgi:hypothetical protein
MIVAKAIDSNSITFQTNLSDSTPFISFGFDVYENLNTDNGEYDSWNTYNALCTYNQLSYNVAINSGDEVYDFVSVTLGKTTYNFGKGEYQNLDGSPFDISTITTALISILGF